MIRIIQVKRLGVEDTSSKRSSRTFRAQVRVLVFSFMLSLILLIIYGFIYFSNKKYVFDFGKIFIIVFSIFEWRLQIEGRNVREAERIILCLLIN